MPVVRTFALELTGALPGDREPAIFTARAEEYGVARHREPFPRHPWDPRAVSDRELIRAESPTLFRCKTPSTTKRVPAGFPREKTSVTRATAR